eukprot:1450927-Prymnesium_polylepis.1
MPIAAAVRAVGEVVKQYHPMLELQFASKQLAIDFMTGEPARLSGKAEVLAPRPLGSTRSSRSGTAAIAASSRARPCGTRSRGTRS